MQGPLMDTEHHPPEQTQVEVAFKQSPMQDSSLCADPMTVKASLPQQTRLLIASTNSDATVPSPSPPRHQQLPSAPPACVPSGLANLRSSSRRHRLAMPKHLSTPAVAIQPAVGGVHALLTSLAHIATSVGQLQQVGIDRAEARKQLRVTIVNLQQQATYLRSQAALEAGAGHSAHMQAIDDMLASLSAALATVDGSASGAGGSPRSVGMADAHFGRGSHVTSGVSSNGTAGDRRGVVDVPQACSTVRRSINKRKWEGIEPLPIKLHTGPPAQHSATDLFYSIPNPESPSTIHIPPRSHSLSGTSALDTWVPHYKYSDMPSHPSQGPSMPGSTATKVRAPASPSTPVAGRLMTKQSSSAVDDFSPWRHALEPGARKAAGLPGAKHLTTTSPAASSSSIGVSVSFRIHIQKPGLNDQEAESPGRVPRTASEFQDLTPDAAQHVDESPVVIPLTENKKQQPLPPLDGRQPLAPSSLSKVDKEIVQGVQGLGGWTLDEHAKERAVRVAAQLATTTIPHAAMHQAWLSSLPSPMDQSLDWSKAWVATPSHRTSDDSSGARRASRDFRGFVKPMPNSVNDDSLASAFQTQVVEVEVVGNWPVELAVPMHEVVVQEEQGLLPASRKEVIDVPKEILVGLEWESVNPSKC